MNGLAVTLALFAAASFALSTSVQHQAAQSAPASVKGVLALMAYLVRRPLWLLGQAIAVGAFLLHAAALNAGAIAVVQPIIVSGIVFAVPARAAVARRMPSAAEVRAVAVTAVGLAVFLVASNPTEGEPAALGAGTLSIAVVFVLVAIGANVAASRVQDEPRRKAFLLGVVAGVCFGLVAVCLKLSLQVLGDDGLGSMLATWPPYALLVAGACGVLTNQRAYRTAGLSASMPVLNIVNGMVALAFGVIVFGEVPRHSPLFLLIEVGAVACMAVGLWMLVQFQEARQGSDVRTATPVAHDAG